MAEKKQSSKEYKNRVLSERGAVSGKGNGQNLYDFMKSLEASKKGQKGKKK